MFIIFMLMKISILLIVGILNECLKIKNQMSVRVSGTLMNRFVMLD